MASAQQATFAAQNGVNWAQPGDPNFGQPGYIGQAQYDQYSAANPGQSTTTAPAPASTTSTPTASTTSPAPITTAAQTTSTATPVGQTFAPGTNATIANSFQQALVNRLNPQPVTAQDPAISGAIGANNLALQRGTELAQNAQAEQNARTGTDSSGGAATGTTGLLEDMAAQQGQYAGNLVNQQSQLNQANETNALGEAGSLLSGQQGLAQQNALAQLSAQLEQAQLAQQGQLGTQSLSNQMTLGQGQLNLGLLSALLANSQFGQSLNQQGQEFGAGLDAQTLMGLLGIA